MEYLICPSPSLRIAIFYHMHILSVREGYFRGDRLKWKYTVSCSHRMTGGCTRISLRDSRVIDGKSLRIKDAFTVAARTPFLPHFVGTGPQKKGKAKKDNKDLFAAPRFAAVRAIVKPLYLDMVWVRPRNRK